MVQYKKLRIVWDYRFFGAVIEILAAGCFLFFLSFHNLETEYPEDFCSSSKNACILKQIEFLGEHYGIATAIKKYEAIVASGEASFSNCHTLAHGVGVLAYQKLSTVYDALSLQHATLAYCYGGYIHGVIAEHIQKDVLDIPLSVAYKRTCEFLKDSKIVYNMCVHGLGHSFLVKTNFDVPSALDACQHIVPHKACAGGVFMENAFVSDPFWHLHTLNHTHTDYTYGNPFALCKISKEKDRATCYWTAPVQIYSEQVLFQKKSLTTVTKTIFIMCNKAGKYKNDCLMGIGALIGKVTNWANSAVQQVCEQGTTSADRYLCAEGVFRERTITTYSPITMEFCNTFSGIYHERCMFFR